MPLFTVVTLEKPAIENVWERRTYVVEAASKDAASRLISDPSSAAWCAPRADRSDVRIVSIDQESLP